MSYLKWDQTTTTDFSVHNINTLYERGFVFGRLGKGIMDQTRSVRINLAKFELSSENRRVLRKTEGLEISTSSIPYSNYHWSLGKLAKDFYDKKFGEKTFSANKVKELLTDNSETNFNTLLMYRFKNHEVGYCICLNTEQLLHYCYPFYNLETDLTNLGLGMMLRAILWAKERNVKYVYIGSAQRPSDTYKLQFTGLEWFDGKAWQEDAESLKHILQKLN